MARKRTEDDRTLESRQKKNLVVIRGYETWRDWLEGYAASKGMPITVLIEHLLREAARKDGYAAPPKRY
jgi:hypothetical protein